MLPVFGDMNTTAYGLLRLIWISVSYCIPTASVRCFRLTSPLRRGLSLLTRLRGLTAASQQAEVPVTIWPENNHRAAETAECQHSLNWKQKLKRGLPPEPKWYRDPNKIVERLPIKEKVILKYDIKELLHTPPSTTRTADPKYEKTWLGMHQSVDPSGLKRSHFADW